MGIASVFKLAEEVVKPAAAVGVAGAALAPEEAEAGVGSIAGAGFKLMMRIGPRAEEAGPAIRSDAVDARQAVLAGKTKLEAYQQTGIHLDDQGPVRLMSDANVVIHPKALKYGERPLSEVLGGADHIFNNYPSARNIGIRLDEGLGADTHGMLSRNEKTGKVDIILNPKSDPAKQRETVLHEVQHYVDAMEGWQAGGVPGSAATKSAYLESIPEAVRTDLKIGGLELTDAVVTSQRAGLIGKLPPGLVQRVDEMRKFGYVSAEGIDAMRELKKLAVSKADFDLEAAVDKAMEGVDAVGHRPISEYEQYLRLRGEANARQTEAFANKTQDELAKVDPSYRPGIAPKAKALGVGVAGLAVYAQANADDSTMPPGTAPDSTPAASEGGTQASAQAGGETATTATPEGRLSFARSTEAAYRQHLQALTNRYTPGARGLSGSFRFPSTQPSTDGYDMTPNGMKQLRIDEGERLSVYRDSRGIATIGVGFNLEAPDNAATFKAVTGKTVEDAIAGRVVLTKAQSQALLDHEVKQAESEVPRLVPAFATLPKPVQDALVNFVFNVGMTTASDFKNTLAAVNRRDGKAAAAGIRKSAYYRQVGARGERVAKALEALKP